MSALESERRLRGSILPMGPDGVMSVNETIEGFLYEIGLPFEKLADGIWVVTNEADIGENLVVYVTDSVLSLRLKMFELPADAPTALYRRLLELNATSVLHGAFGIEKNAVVLVGALEIENLDRNEFQAIIDSFSLALTTHHEELAALLST
jgi:hypothetical protein